MRIRLDNRSGEPIYRQIVEAVKYGIVSGELPDESKLPSIRSLANELSINPRTVVKAYEELQNNGLVVMRHGQGVFVCTDQGKTPRHVRRSILGEQVRRLLAEGYRLGAAPEEIETILREEIDRLEGER